MQGLKLAREYYFAYGLPMINEHFRHISDRIAVGLVGPGSECYGYDDDLSRDHDWGPGFCIWLQHDDYQKYRAELENAYASLPKVFAGYGPRLTSPGEEKRTGVMSIQNFYTCYTGLDHPPQNFQEWLSLSEQSLSICTNGIVLYDPLDSFSAWRRQLLSYYPEDIRRKKIASRCMTIAQTGQYNLGRSLMRDEPFASRYAEIQFCHEMMSLAFLLNKQYPPFYKWLHRATKQLPILGSEIHQEVTRLITTTDYREKADSIDKLCNHVIEEFVRQGLSFLDSRFLIDHGPVIQSGIRDQELRKHFKLFN